jgi:riboflavin kinase, archaea type
MSNRLNIIIYLAHYTGLFDSFKFKTSEIAKEFNISQQSASRILIELEKEKYIKRIHLQNGIEISLDDKARTLIKEYHKLINNLFKNSIKLKGIIVEGIGQGKYYVSLKEYKKQFKEKLDINPFAGTLNIKVKLNKKKEFLENKNMILINGFIKKNRTFGDILAYKVRIKNIVCSIIIPKRTSHEENIIEIISNFNLREKFKLKTNDEIIIE